MRMPKSIPARMPTDYILKQIAFPPPQSHFHAFTTIDGSIRPPLISYRNQWRIRKACALAGLDPVTAVGVPTVEHVREQKWIAAQRKEFFRLNRLAEEDDWEKERERRMAGRVGKKGEVTDAAVKKDVGAETKAATRGRAGRIKLQKGNDWEIKKYERQKKIAENMAAMPEKIAAWKAEKKKYKDSLKSDMPF
ncbi:hypothetical protein HK101_000455 [Irineochytrium annulatum]|nr:hypothetical protein HK101_000455 [Irineochytrium annulatum]